jgi:hypothetical protein
MTTKMAKFIIERHKIFLRRQRGDAKPWTTDPILRDNRFCNIYRELDTVSVWIRDNVITKYEDNPNLWFMLAISRLINWPDTLQELMDGKAWPIKTWNPDLAFKILDAKAKRKEKVITGAYLINSVPPKDANPKDRRKVYYIPYFGLTPMWEARKEIAPVFKTTLTDSVNTLKQFHGWSNFMSYQVVVDLTYSDQWLMNAPDYNTFNSPGPGTQRGLSRYFTGGIGGGLDKKELNKLIIQQRKEVNAKLKELLPSKLITKDFSTGFETISLSNMSNSNCEFDKHQRVFLGESKMRSKYNGAK